MTRFQKITTVALLLGVAISAALPTLLSGAAPSRFIAGSRTIEAIETDLRNAQAEATKVMPSLLSLADADFRKGDGQKAVPHLKKMVGLMRELEEVAPSKDEKDYLRTNRYMYMSFVAVLGDKETTDSLAETGKGNGPDAVLAKSALAMDGWILASKDPAGQIKVLEDFTPVARQNPENEAVTSTLAAMTSFAPANDDVTKKVIGVIRNNLKGEGVKGLLAMLDGQMEQKAMVGKPLAVSGRTSTGGTFATADLKGKVVLLDFWATWCGPCIAELPNVKKAYADFHAKGFEIVGFSCDADDEVLNTFTAKNEMPWIQLRELSQNERSNWHPIAKQFHVDGIPQMFLVDRQGILRYVDARENLAKKVADLLAEPAPAAK